MHWTRISLKKKLLSSNRYCFDCVLSKMNLLPLSFLERLPSSPAIQAATFSIKEKIRVGQEKYEQSIEIPESLSSPWADDNDLKLKINEAQNTNRNDDKIKEHYGFKVRLQETKTILIFEMLSKGYLEGTAQGEQVMKTNELRLKLREKAGRLTSNQSCQTEIPLLLRKCIQTKQIFNKGIGCTVTEWDMMDSFKKLDSCQKKNVDSSSEKGSGISDRFSKASLVIQRLLASNNYNCEQLIYSFRPRDIGRSFKYSLAILWKTNEPGTGGVNNIATNSANRNLLAVGYGDRGKAGTICIWNAKNPQTPEKKISFHGAVMSTSFSKEAPYCLASVTETGDVLIVDVRTCNPRVTVVSSSVTTVIMNSLWTVSWFYNEDLLEEKEQIMAAGYSGVVTLWNPINSSKKDLAALSYNNIPNDNMYVHKYDKKGVENRNPFMRATFNVVDIDLDPKDKKTFYVSTAQGSLLMCKTSTILGSPSSYPTHRGAVLGSKHLPSIPSVFLTYGADAKTIIWVHGVQRPIASLSTDSLEPIICALWLPSHCSIILTLSRSFVNLWDISRSDLDPMTVLTTEKGIDYTTAIFNATGTVAFIGSSDGSVTAFNLQEMPHSPYLKKNHLLAAFKRILRKNKALYDEIEYILNTQ